MPTSLDKPSEQSRTRSPGAQLELPHVRVDLGGHAEGPGQDVPLGVDGRLRLGHLAVAHALLGQAVVVGDLGHLPVGEDVGPRIARHWPAPGRPGPRRRRPGPWRSAWSPCPAGRRWPGSRARPRCWPPRRPRAGPPTVGARSKACSSVSTATRAATSPPTWPPMPSATAKRFGRSSGMSWLIVRTRPTSVAEPDRSTVTGRPRRPSSRSGAGRPCPAASRLLDLLGVDERAVGRAEVLDPELVVAPEEAGVQRRGVDVLGHGDAATGRAPDRQLVVEVVGLPGVLGRLHHLEVELPAAALLGAVGRPRRRTLLAPLLSAAPSASCGWWPGSSRPTRPG